MFVYPEPVIKARYVDRDAPEPEWKALHRAADNFVPRLKDVFNAGRQVLRRGLSLDDMREAARLGVLPKDEALIEWRETLTRGFESFLLDTLMAGVKVSKPFLERQAGIAIRKQTAEMVFDAENERATRYVRTHAAELVQQVDDETRKAIQAIIARGQREGLSVEEMADRLRRIVGLTERDAIAVENFRAGLIESGVAEAIIERRVEERIARGIARRAENIARTETIQAANAGQQALWQEAWSQGLVDRDTTQREWIVTADDRTCPICLPMDGQRRGLNEEFESPYDGTRALHPPLHPSCRCATALAVEPV